MILPPLDFWPPIPTERPTEAEQRRINRQYRRLGTHKTAKASDRANRRRKLEKATKKAQRKGRR